MVSKLFKTFLAVVLAVTLSVPLAACQSDSASKAASISSASTDVASYRWENFDDGCDIMSLDVPYIPANVSTFSFNIILEQGKFIEDINAGQIALSGAVEGWLVDRVERKDDVTVFVDVSKPDGWSKNGAALAQVAVSANAVEDEATASDEAETASEAEAAERRTEEAQGGEELTADEINAEIGVAWPTDDESAVIENIDVELNDIEADENGGDQETADATDEDDEGTSATYVVAVVFADPYLDLEADSLSFRNDKLTLKMKAVDFTLDGRIGKDNLSVVNSNGENPGVTIESVSLSTSSEIEVVLGVSGANLNVLDDAGLVLAADANETQDQVSGALKIPDPVLYVSSEYRDDEKAVLVAELSDTNDKMLAEDITVFVDGAEVRDAAVTQNDDGTCEVSVPVSSIQSNPVVEVSVSNIEDYAGQPVSRMMAAASVEETEVTRGVVGDFISDAAGDIGIGALSSLAEFGLKKFYYSYVNPDAPEAVTNKDLLQKLATISSSLDGTNMRLRALYDTVQSGNYGTIINNTNDIASTLSSQGRLLAGKMKKVDAAGSKEEKEAALKELYAKDSNQILVDNITVNLNRLYDKLMLASASDNKDLIQVYDDMCALSYNWGSQTYDMRKQFRNELAKIWVEEVTQVYAIYEAAAQDEQSATLSRLDEMTKEVKKLIGDTHKIDESCYKKTKSGADAYYNYTLGKWLTTALGSASKVGWSKAIVDYEWKTVKVETPFASYSKKRAKYRSNENAFTSSGLYVTTAEVKSLLARLHGKTLGDELKSVGMVTAKYLITSERLDGSAMHSCDKNNWYMDTFEISLVKADGSGFTSGKQHFDGYRSYKSYRGGTHGHVNWHTQLSDMFILKYATV